MNIALIFFRLWVLLIALVAGSIGFQWFILKEWQKGAAMLFSAFVAVLVPFWAGIHALIWLWSLIGTQLRFEERYGKAWGMNFTQR